MCLVLQLIYVPKMEESFFLVKARICCLWVVLSSSRIYLLRQGTVPSGSPSPPGLLHSLAFPVQPRWPLEFVIPGSEAATAPELVAGQGVLSEGRQEQPGIWLL